MSFNIDKQISKWKTFSFQLDWDFMFEYNSLGISLDYTRKTDHPGVSFSLELVVLRLYTSITDIRHWDDENNCYYDYYSKG